jgi:pyridinium-3,5-bisthiocarboxylic acid mononucleotide nickel chelatase
MELTIDTRNGIAGDIVSAGLLALGASPEKIIPAMEFAAELIGNASILPVYSDGTVSIEIDLGSNFTPMPESKARNHLEYIADYFEFDKTLRKIGNAILDTLCTAERYVHTHDPRLQHMLSHPHHHDHHPSFAHGKQEALLHEAQDILIDITGLLIGFQELNISSIFYLQYVNVGSGTITFSHGTFDVPAPATRYILDTLGMNWLRSMKYQKEMTTPTGASILAGLGAQRITELGDRTILKQGVARGTRKDLPPVHFYLSP